ncbi:MAG: serine/threonine-protein kinase [Kofleriaceae bacterium]
MRVTNPLPPRSHDFIGRSVGNYKIMSLIGEGGMGAVYAAENRYAGKRAAVKVINREFAGNQELVARFWLEGQAVAALDDEHIVDVYDAGVLADDGMLYIVMEYIDGCSLESLCSQMGPLPVDVAAMIMLQIASGLNAVHAAAIVHRDMKPQNVMISRRRGRLYFVTIVDFGIAKLLNPHLGAGYRTQTSAVLGTPGMMAPEQARGERDVDARADVYSFGAMLYRMVTGQPPFSAETQFELVERQLKGAFPRPRALRPDLPKSWEDTIVAALQSDRKLRPGSMAELAQRIAQPLPNGDVLLQVLAPSLRATAPLPASANTMAGGLEASLASWPSSVPKRRGPILPAAIGAIAGIVVGAGAMKLTSDRAIAPVAEERVEQAAAPPEAAMPARDATVAAIAAPVLVAAGSALTPTTLRDAAVADAADHGSSSPSAGPAMGSGSASIERPEAAPARSGSQKITIKVRPWAEVFLDGGSTGRQTPTQLTLRAGKHRVRLVGAEKTENLTITVDPAKGIFVKSDLGAAESFKLGRAAEIKRNWQ